jgi:DNA-binding MarR family transcriptional regulator
MSQEPMQETTSRLLSQVCRLKRARVHALLGKIGLYRGQPFVLCALWEREGMTHSELAQRLHVQPATMTNMLKRMERAGLVNRQQDMEDHRVSRVYLTDAGRDIRDAVEETWSELEEQACAGFTPEEQTLLRQFLLRIRENLTRERHGHNE